MPQIATASTLYHSDLYCSISPCMKVANQDVMEGGGRTSQLEVNRPVGCEED